MAFKKLTALKKNMIFDSHFKNDVINDNLIYIDWENPTPSSPRTLVKTDFDKLVDSSKLFARKLDMTRDSEILDLIDQKILNSN